MTEEVERFAKVVAALDLPSWEHVGAFLISQGITESDVGNSLWFACRCPIAQYLRRHGFPEAVVGLTSAWMANEIDPVTDAFKGTVLLPISAKQFIGMHDSWRDYWYAR